MSESIFNKLNDINVSDHVEKKGNFSYLSWVWAVQQLRKACPSAVWEVKRFDGLPFLRTELGTFVEVAVTVEGITLSQIHPVLDNRNKPLPTPSSFDINTSIQRCLVKAIALHGLGLYIYAGEDLPESEKVETEKVTVYDGDIVADIQATKSKGELKDLWAKLNKSQQEKHRNEVGAKAETLP